MKAILLLLLLFLATSSLAQRVWTTYPHTINSNSLSVDLAPTGEIPEYVAVIVLTNDPADQWQKDWQKALDQWRIDRKTNPHAKPPDFSPYPFQDYNDLAKWVPFKTNIQVDLGPGDGNRKISFGYRYHGEARAETWSGSTVYVRTQKPFIGITAPTQTTVSQPMISLEGYCPEPLEAIHYDVFNSAGMMVQSNVQTYVNNQDYDTELARFTTNYFTCLYIPLASGTNTIVLRCTDDAGNNILTNFTYVLDLGLDKTPPVMSVDWPQPEMSITVGSFSARGKLDKATDTILGIISANGQTNTVHGEVEWSHFINGAGYFWVENLPVSIGTNYLALIATDAAGHSSSTNLVLYGDEGPIITMDPVTPAVDLWKPYLDITGKVSPANNPVWINGVQAVVNADGTWLAKHVPVVSPNIGTACFDMTTTPPTANNPTKPGEMFFTQTSLGTNAITLNPSTPVSGIFQLLVSNPDKRNFVLLASTNLMDWVPILTNSNPEATFSYRDTNANHYKSRFFRVVPLQ